MNVFLDFILISFNNQNKDTTKSGIFKIRYHRSPPSPRFDVSVVWANLPDNMLILYREVSTSLSYIQDMVILLRYS